MSVGGHHGRGGLRRRLRVAGAATLASFLLILAMSEVVARLAR